MNNLDAAVGGLGQLNAAALSALGRLNTHDYHTNPNPGRLKEYKSLAQKLHKPVWMSELGCCFPGQGDGTEMWGAFYALAQYTRFIRPGFRIISAGGAYNTLAAYSSSAKQLVLVSTNWDAVTRNDLDLSAFATNPSSAAVYRTTVDSDANLREGSIDLSTNGHIIDELPIR